jgi:hypothetical protein
MNGTSLVLDSKNYSKDHIFKAPAFHFNTYDIEAAFEFMKGKNVHITSEIKNNHWFKFKDPDGNQLMVCSCLYNA